MNFFRKAMSQCPPEILSQVTNYLPGPGKDSSFVDGLAEDAGGFLQKFVPDGVDATEMIQMALNGLDWGSLFTPDTVEDCDGFDPEYFGEEEEEDGEEPPVEGEDEDDEAWEGDEADEADLDPDAEFSDKRFQRRNETYSGNAVEWTAPEAPEFVRDGMSINDIKQNAIGDCWFLASLSSLASRRERISFVIQKRRNETANPETGYEFKFYKMGKWVVFKVDKYLPTNIAAIAADNEHWVPYCEKAYAKRYRTYDAITGGWGCWGLTDLTGGIAIKTEIHWKARGIHELYAWLYDNQSELLITSGISGGDGGAGGEVLQENGLYEGHEYSLLKLEVVKTDDGMVVQLLQIRNPWGKGEFNGDWSDYSDKWDTIPAEKREKLNVQREDGAFWMCYKDWVNMFSSFDVCLLPSQFDEKKRGPRFEDESGLRGKFADDPKIKLKIVVTQKRNVYIQCLLDCGIAAAKAEQFICINLKDQNEEMVIPRLPNDFKPNTYSNYSHNGYLFNLDVGEYTLVVNSYLLSAGGPSCNPGTRWFVRTVGKGVTLQRM